ncbi:hypothetical protein FOZ63_032756 [Perkinsus olseni]|uniref:Uncharacterized protein n=1 Tax=Perkinsus olseni TaxID=32597 RepID=A0A7J6PVK3_PEROL|nr:hypothetical protein FOZ63_032756 [Perkinsus olseni]
MVSGTLNLALELRACELKFGKMGHQFVDSCAFTMQFFGRRNPKGFHIPDENGEEPKESKCCVHPALWEVIPTYGMDSNNPAGLRIRYDSGKTDWVRIPTEPSEGDVLLKGYGNYAHNITRALEGPGAKWELWELNIPALQWRKRWDFTDDLMDYGDIDVTVNAAGDIRVAAVENRPNGSIKLWDGMSSSRLFKCSEAHGNVRSLCFVSWEVLLVSTRKGFSDDVGELMLYYVGLDGPCKMLARTWWVSSSEPPFFWISRCGHYIHFDEKLLHPPVQDLKLVF